MTDRALIRNEALRLRGLFEAAGAEPFEAPILLPAETLLDLYGEDIRARAYVTQDPLRGEQMLRPDFTVPVAEAHMQSGRDNGCYTYFGVIFRQQDEDPDRPSEYFQTGIELFGDEDPAEADAAIFAAIADALEPLPVRAVTGDIGVILAAIEGLQASDVRKAALRRHLWRPRRFVDLLDRFAGRSAISAERASLLAAVAAGADPVAAAGPQIGLRTAAEVRARLDRLVADAAEPPIPAAQVALLGRLLTLKGALPEIPVALMRMAAEMPALDAAATRIADRCAALEARGIDVDSIEFEASFGRTALEYYDGFVFGFVAEAHEGTGVTSEIWPPVASGGRYDALTRVLGGGRGVPAVGAVIRPEMVLRLRAEAGEC